MFRRCCFLGELSAARARKNFQRNGSDVGGGKHKFDVRKEKFQHPSGGAENFLTADATGCRPRSKGLWKRVTVGGMSCLGGRRIEDSVWVAATDWGDFLPQREQRPRVRNKVRFAVTLKLRYRNGHKTKSRIRGKRLGPQWVLNVGTAAATSGNPSFLTYSKDARVTSMSVVWC